MICQVEMYVKHRIVKQTYLAKRFWSTQERSAWEYKIGRLRRTSKGNCEFGQRGKRITKVIYCPRRWLEKAFPGVTKRSSICVESIVIAQQQAYSLQQPEILVGLYPSGIQDDSAPPPPPLVFSQLEKKGVLRAFVHVSRKLMVPEGN